MSAPHPPRVAVALLHRFVDDEALIGDLIERFSAKRSRTWFWRQVLLTIVLTWTRPRPTPHPLQLEDHFGEDEVEPRILPRRVNLTASPLPGIGGLGLVAFGVLIAVVRPEAWWIFLPAVAGGCILGGLMVFMRRPEGPFRMQNSEFRMQKPEGKRR